MAYFKREKVNVKESKKKYEVECMKSILHAHISHIYRLILQNVGIFNSNQKQSKYNTQPKTEPMPFG